MQSGNKLLTKDKEQLQFLLQAVSDYRNACPDVRIITLPQQSEH